MHFHYLEMLVEDFKNVLLLGLPLGWLIVKIVTDKKTGDALGFAYVWFSSEEFA